MANKQLSDISDSSLKLSPALVRGNQAHIELNIHEVHEASI